MLLTAFQQILQYIYQTQLPILTNKTTTQEVLVLEKGSSIYYTNLTFDSNYKLCDKKQAEIE